MDPSIWHTAIWPYVNFAIFLGILGFFARKPLAAFAQNRAQAFSKDAAAAKEAHRQAEERLAQVNKELADLDNTVQNLRDEARRAIEREAQRHEKQAEEQSARLVREADGMISAREAAATASLRQELLNLVREEVARELARRLDEAGHGRIVADSCRTLEAVAPGEAS